MHCKAVTGYEITWLGLVWISTQVSIESLNVWNPSAWNSPGIWRTRVMSCPLSWKIWVQSITQNTFVLGQIISLLWSILLTDKISIWLKDSPCSGIQTVVRLSIKTSISHFAELSSELILSCRFAQKLMKIQEGWVNT